MTSAVGATMGPEMEAAVAELQLVKETTTGAYLKLPVNHPPDIRSPE